MGYKETCLYKFQVKRGPKREFKVFTVSPNLNQLYLNQSFIPNFGGFLDSVSHAELIEWQYRNHFFSPIVPLPDEANSDRVLIMHYMDLYDYGRFQFSIPCPLPIHTEITPDGERSKQSFNGAFETVLNMLASWERFKVLKGVVIQKG